MHMHNTKYQSHYYITSTVISFSDELIVKFESDGDNNVLDSGCTCHEMEPMVGKTEVKEETNTDWDVKPTLSHTTGTTAFENGMLCFSSLQKMICRLTDWLNVKFCTC